MARPKKCPECGDLFHVERMGQKTCRKYECAIAYGRKLQEKKKLAQEKEKRKEIKERKEKIKTRSDWAKEAQIAFNAYIRERDKDDDCISCGRPASWGGQWHASHFKSVGANSFLRFNEWNVHKACSICNNHLSGNLAEYAMRLPGKIGAERFEFLLTAPRVRSYDVDYLKRIIKIYKKKLGKKKMVYS